MKPLKRLKLTQLSKAELENREMNSLFGGYHYDYYCCCGCTVDVTDVNADSNMDNGYTKSKGWTWGLDGNDACACGCQSDEGHDQEHRDAVQNAANDMGSPL